MQNKSKRVRRKQDSNLRAETANDFKDYFESF